MYPTGGGVGQWGAGTEQHCRSLRSIKITLTIVNKKLFFAVIKLKVSYSHES